LDVKYGEVCVGQIFKSCGGRWNIVKGYWDLPYREVVAFGLDNCTIDD